MSEDKFKQDKDMILSVYRGAFEEFGPCPRGITWGSYRSQEVRFEVLTSIGDLDKASVLDFGCGMGDLFPYLRDNTHADMSQYLGVDINGQLLTEAKKRYPSGNFVMQDILQEPLDREFDFVLSSGAFAIGTEHWEEFTFRILDDLFGRCRKALGFNLLTNRSKTATGDHYVDPCWMLGQVLDRYSSKVVIRHDYKDNDFSLYIYK